MTPPTPQLDLAIYYHQNHAVKDTFGSSSWLDRNNRLSNEVKKDIRNLQNRQKFIHALHNAQPASSIEDTKTRLEWLIWDLCGSEGYLVEQWRYFRDDEDRQKAALLFDNDALVKNYLQQKIDLKAPIQEEFILEQIRHPEERALPLGVILAKMGYSSVFEYLPPSVSYEYAEELLELAAILGEVKEVGKHYQLAMEQDPSQKDKYLKLLWYGFTKTIDLKTPDFSVLPDPPASWWDGTFYTPILQQLAGELLLNRPHLKMEYIQGILNKGDNSENQKWLSEEEFGQLKASRSIWRNSEGWNSSLIGTTILGGHDEARWEKWIKPNLHLSHSQSSISDEQWLQLAFLSDLSKNAVNITKQKFAGTIPPFSKNHLSKWWDDLLDVAQESMKLADGKGSPKTFQLLSQAFSGLCKHGLIPKENGQEFRRNPEKVDLFLQLLQKLNVNSQDLARGIDHAQLMASIFPQDKFLNPVEWGKNIDLWKKVALYGYVIKLHASGNQIHAIDSEDILNRGSPIAELGLPESHLQWMYQLLSAAPDASLEIRAELGKITLEQASPQVSHVRRGPRL